MKKRYGLNLIIGKKSSLRYPTHLFLPVIEKLTVVLPARIAAAEPPLSTNIMLKKGDPFEFCDAFNESTDECEPGFPVRVLLLFVATELLFELKGITVAAMFDLAFDFAGEPLETFNEFQNNTVIAVSNACLVRLDEGEDYFVSSIVEQARLSYSTMNSWHIRRRLVNKPYVFVRNHYVGNRRMLYRRCRYYIRRVISRSRYNVMKYRWFSSFYTPELVFYGHSVTALKPSMNSQDFVLKSCLGRKLFLFIPQKVDGLAPFYARLCVLQSLNSQRYSLVPYSHFIFCILSSYVRDETFNDK